MKWILNWFEERRVKKALRLALTGNYEYRSFRQLQKRSSFDPATTVRLLRAIGARPDGKEDSDKWTLKA